MRHLGRDQINLSGLVGYEEPIERVGLAGVSSFTMEMTILLSRYAFTTLACVLGVNWISRHYGIVAVISGLIE
jgi:hypothetical protein